MQTNSEHPVLNAAERSREAWDDTIRHDAIALLRDDERRNMVRSGFRRVLKATTQPVD